jgi:hypothetical protein
VKKLPPTYFLTTEMIEASSKVPKTHARKITQKVYVTLANNFSDKTSVNIRYYFTSQIIAVLCNCFAVSL